MRTTETTGPQLLRKIEDLERQLAHVASQVNALERHAHELDELRREVGKLKFAIEEMREE